jgi:peptidoglycan hydrolase CwlO-like protein
MEQILSRLLAKINAIQGKMDSCQERMGEKLGPEMKTIQELMDNKQEEKKDQMGSLTSQINANHEEMKAMLEACLGKMEANPGELRP